ncbi:hypothetical protein CJT87_33400 [Pseudomonas aeruginosa]|nr:hypothetical protein CJT87_33400 [Pseudomonas aeruginosa]
MYPTRIEVVADDALIASHVRLLDRDQVSYDWQHYLPLIERNRSINPVLADGFFQEAEAEAGEQFHGSSAS